MTKALTPAQRQKRHRERGRVVSVTLTCPLAIAALARIQAEYGSVRVGLEALLRGDAPADPLPPIKGVRNGRA